MIEREAISTALFGLLRSSVSSFKTTSRRLAHWQDVPATQQPAMYMVEVNQSAAVTTRVPTIWTFNYSLYLYAHTGGDRRQPPMSILNPLIDQIVDVLKLTGGDVEQTLGGLIHRCRITGSIDTDEGVLGDQAVAIIPVQIIAPQ